MASAQFLGHAAQVYSKHSLEVAFRLPMSAHRNLKTVKLEMPDSYLLKSLLLPKLDLLPI